MVKLSGLRAVAPTAFVFPIQSPNGKSKIDFIKFWENNKEKITALVQKHFPERKKIAVDFGIDILDEVKIPASLIKYKGKTALQLGFYFYSGGGETGRSSSFVAINVVDKDGKLTDEIVEHDENDKKTHKMLGEGSITVNSNTSKIISVR